MEQISFKTVEQRATGTDDDKDNDCIDWKHTWPSGCFA